MTHNAEGERRMNIGVVSPYVLTRKALCALLAPAGDFCVVMDVDDALADFEVIRKSRPDILIIEVLSPTSELATVSRLREQLPDVKILLISDAADEEFQIRAIRAGAQGCVSKRSDPLVLERALKIVGQGEVWLGHQVVTRLIGRLMRSHDREEGGTGGLTQREWEILGLVANGYRNKEIANRLFLSENTVKTHLYTIYRKLQVSTRLGAALHYFQRVKEGTDPARAVTVSASRGSDLQHGPRPGPSRKADGD